MTDDPHVLADVLGAIGLLTLFAAAVALPLGLFALICLRANKLNHERDLAPAPGYPPDWKPPKRSPPSPPLPEVSNYPACPYCGARIWRNCDR